MLADFFNNIHPKQSSCAKTVWRMTAIGAQAPTRTETE
jgi:hypothetical protein